MFITNNVSNVQIYFYDIKSYNLEKNIFKKHIIRKNCSDSLDQCFSTYLVMSLWSKNGLSMKLFIGF